jgi:hypothetical protein
MIPVLALVQVRHDARWWPTLPLPLILLWPLIPFVVLGAGMVVGSQPGAHRARRIGVSMKTSVGVMAALSGLAVAVSSEDGQGFRFRLV